ncbi:MAG: hypothetical protein IJ200_10300 [Prevotella sp.]|nr:hypothetical protein [Prevotella sp.]
MNKRIILTGIFILCLTAINARNTMNLVKVPDSVAHQLDSIYFVQTGKRHVNAGINVHNLINYKNTKFQNGVYIFGGMGPHFPKMIFIHYDSNIYVITSRKIPEMLNQLNEANEKIQISNKDFITYLKFITNYIAMLSENNSPYSYYTIM